MIYLHGMDIPSVGDQEVGNRVILSQLAAELDIRIALPRATVPCPSNPDQVCWGWQFDGSEIVSESPIILEGRKSCFSNSQSFGVIGFSNGGYFVNSWYLRQLSTEATPAWMISVAAGFGKPPISPEIPSQLYELVTGTQDRFNYDPNEQFFHQLESLGLSPKLFQFSGGHIFDHDAVLAALKSAIGP